MANFYAQYPASSASANASVGTNGAPAPTSSTEIGGVNGGGNLTPVSVDNSGNVNVNVVSSTLPTGGATAANQVLEIADLNALNARTAGSLTPVRFDEVDLTYVPSGPGTGQVQTAVYKLATVTVKTLTLSYDGSDRLSSVVAS